MMCEIKSFDDLLEKFSAEEAGNHIGSCAECFKKYSGMFELLYPEIPMEKPKFKKESLWKRSRLFRMAPIAAGLAAAAIISFFFVKAPSVEKGINGYSELSYNDCLEIMDSMGDDEFVEIINSVQEGL